VKASAGEADSEDDNSGLGGEAAAARDMVHGDETRAGSASRDAPGRTLDRSVPLDASPERQNEMCVRYSESTCVVLCEDILLSHCDFFHARVKTIENPLNYRYVKVKTPMKPNPPSLEVEA
jgi:hypothetical protein